MLTPEDRINNLEALVVKLTNELEKDIATFDELDAVVTAIFEEQAELEERIVAVENNLDVVEETISQRQG